MQSISSKHPSNTDISFAVDLSFEQKPSLFGAVADLSPHFSRDVKGIVHFEIYF